jgi:lysozyme family protein
MTLSPEVAKILEVIITAQEGGWKIWHTEGDNDGGWTLAGVTASTYNRQYNTSYNYAAMEDRWNNLRDSVVAEIYHVYEMDYLSPLHLDYLPESIRGPLASCAINCGTQTAVKLFQRTVGTSTVDGFVGATTIHYANSYSSDLLEDFLKSWLAYYHEIVANNPEYQKFTDGWNNRVTYWASNSTGV